MALKLKLKVKPSQPPEGGPENELTSSSRHPKIKTESSDRVSKPKHKKEKLKKLRLSLGKLGLPSVTPVASAPLPPSKPILKKIPKVRIKPTRIPGEGYDSEAPDVEDDPLIEQGILIRFMDDANLDFVHNAVSTGDLSNVNIKWITREKAVINVNLTLYSARLLDLPTLTELYKTVDKKNIFKTIDISQILLVLHPINPKQLNMETDFEVPESHTYTHPIYELSTNKEIRNTKSVYRHGLSYAFEDVYRRFKPRKVNHRVMQDIELRVDELVRRDAEAQESHYEYVDPSTQNRRGGSHSHVGTPSQSIPSTPSARALSPREAEEYEAESQQEMDIDLEADIDNALEQELAEALDSTSNNTAATVLMKSEFDNEEEVSDEEAGAGQAGGDDDDEDEEEEEEEDDEDEEDAGDGLKEETSKVKKLEEEIGELEKAAEKQKKLLSTASYRMMRMKFQSAYNNLKGQLDQKKRELAKIKELQQKTQAPETQRQPEEEEDEDDDDDVDDEDDEDNEEDKKETTQKSQPSNEGANEGGPIPDNEDDQEMENEDYGDLQDLF